MTLQRVHLVKYPVPHFPYEEVAEKVLGDSYELSLVFIGSTRMRRINRETRGKDEDTNVLAFPLSKKSGEIFINPSKTKGFSIPHLFIHGTLHLKGHRHGSTMEQTEALLLKTFLYDKKHSNRNRHRDTRNTHCGC